MAAAAVPRRVLALAVAVESGGAAAAVPRLLAVVEAVTVAAGVWSGLYSSAAAGLCRFRCRPRVPLISYHSKPFLSLLFLPLLCIAGGLRSS